MLKAGKLHRWLRSLGATLFASLLSTAAPADEAVTIFAAASTTNAVNEIAALYEAEGLGAVRPVFAASSTLARQIANGAPADLFLSANTAWMEHLEQQGLVEEASRTDLLGNALVLVVPADSALPDGDLTGIPLQALLGDGHLAIGDPDHVPAGIYAVEALGSLGLWPKLSRKAVRAANVRAALAFVESGAAAAGIVYASDAAISRKVRRVATFPADSHAPIVYPLAAVVGRDRPAVARFRDFLRGPQAAAIFARHGFQPLAAPAAAQPQG